MGRRRCERQDTELNLINDAVAEADEDFSLTLSAPTGGAQLAASEATTIIASEDGPGQLEFSSALDLRQVLEDFQGEQFQISVPVRRTGGSQGAVSVDYSTTDGTATAGTDFTAASGTLNWADGDTDVKLIELATIPDSAAEGNEDFQIRLSNPTGGATISLLGGTQLVRILDDDDTGLRFAGTGATVDEADGSVSLSVSRGASGNGPVSVDYGTTSGSATSGSDFTSANGTLNWADGDTADKTIVIDITDDMAEENDENFTVTVSNPSGGTPLGANSTATVTITDNDAPSGGNGNGGGGGGALDWLVLLFLASPLSLLAAGRRGAMRRIAHPAQRSRWAALHRGSRADSQDFRFPVRQVAARTAPRTRATDPISEVRWSVDFGPRARADSPRVMPETPCVSKNWEWWPGAESNHRHADFQSRAEN